MIGTCLNVTQSQSYHHIANGGHKPQESHFLLGCLPQRRPLMPPLPLPMPTCNGCTCRARRPYCTRLHVLLPPSPSTAASPRRVASATPSGGAITAPPPRTGARLRIYLWRHFALSRLCPVVPRPLATVASSQKVDPALEFIVAGWGYLWLRLLDPL